jgi:hypothetical protein
MRLKKSKLHYVAKYDNIEIIFDFHQLTYELSN